MNRPPFTSSPPSQPSPYRYLGRGGGERPVKLQLIIALVAGLILVAVPLYLWRRPRPEPIPTADAAVVDAGAPVAASPVVAFDAGATGHLALAVHDDPVREPRPRQDAAGALRSRHDVRGRALARRPRVRDLRSGIQGSSTR